MRNKKKKYMIGKDEGWVKVREKRREESSVDEVISSNATGGRLTPDVIEGISRVRE